MKKVVSRESVFNVLPMFEIIGGQAILKEENVELRESLLEDYPELKNEKEELVLKRIKRYKKVVDVLKLRYHNRCQIERHKKFCVSLF